MKRPSLAASAALTAYAALLALTAPAWPDDWDGIGFVESIGRFDMARFQPHPPGYPVYVALLRVGAWLARDPMRGCVLVAVACGVATVAWTWGAVRAVAGERAAWFASVMVAVAPLSWRACSGVGSEAPAMACLAAAAWGLARDLRTDRGARVAIGLAVGLGLGVRLSWAPLWLAALLLVPRKAMAGVSAIAVGAGAAWAIPLVAVVGRAPLVALYEAHFAGHAQRWGGTIATEPGAIRLAWLGRDVFVDGLGAGGDALGVVLALLLVVSCAIALASWRSVRWRGWKAAVVAFLPYTVWIGLGQNLRDQPRHALPLVVLLAGVLALPLAVASRRTSVVLGALAVLLATRTALDAHARRTIPPPGEQLVELARRQPSPDRLAVFGVSSVRFFETTELAAHAFPAGALGDVQVRLTHLDRLPSRVWVTSEIEGRGASPYPLDAVATLCRPARIDRRAPCLDVYAWKLPYLR